MENLRFEESFKEAFTGAEIAPSGVVWTNVELGLEKSSGGKLKGRILFFQLLAAASMVFAMGVGSVYFLNTKYNTVQPIAQESAIPKQRQKQDAVNNSSVNKNQHQDQKAVVNSEKRLNKKQTLKNENLNFESSVVVTPVQQVNTASDHELSSISKNRVLPRLVEVEKPRLKIPTNEPDPGMLLLAKLYDQEKKIQKDKPKLKERIWASLGMGAGTYNPNPGTSGKLYAMTGANFSSSSVAAPSSGTSYSVGVSVAGKISKRVVLQGGISYLSQNSTYTSSTASGSNAFLNDYANVSKAEALAGRDQINVTSPYQVDNNLLYMSIPMQAGYIIIDRDFGLQLNAGIATDVFFQNTLTPESSDLEEVTQGAGSDSPYRTLTFSGLLGTELSYKVSDHYRVALNPGFRYALNSIYKSEVAAEVSPITFDVALRFRYMF